MPPVLATLLSATLNGITGRVVRVEVDVAPGLPGFTIVGLPDAALSEARERVRGALRNAGFHHPPRRITVNLAPAEVRKAGASLDLAIALGILLGSEQVRAGQGRIALIGELGLGGEVRHVPGILPMAIALAARGIRRVVVPADAAAEASLAPGIEPVPVATVAEAAEVVRAARSRRRFARAAAAGGHRRRRRRGACRGSRRAGRRAGRGPRRRPRPGGRATGARDRPRRRPRDAPDRPARLGEDAARADHPGSPPGPRRRGGALGDGVASVAARQPDHGARAPPARAPAAPHHLLCRHGRWRPAPVAGRGHPGAPGDARAATSCPSSGGTSSRRSASRSRTAASRWSGSGGRRCSRRGSRSSRR